MTNENESGPTPSAVGSKAIAAVVGASVGGVPGALAAVALEPVFLHLAEKSWGELSEVRRRSAGLLMQRTSSEIGGDPEEVTRRAFQTPDKAQLLADALQAAVGTSNALKIHALAKALANGILGDDARVDEERLIVAGLSGLEAPHIRALALLPRQKSRPVGTPTASAKSSAGRRGVRTAVLAEAAGLGIEGATNVLAELVRTGMASRDTYAADRRHDRYLIDLQDEVTKLQWLANNPGKKMPPSRKPKALKKPGASIEPGFERTPFGDLCLQYLESLPDDLEAQEAEERREESED